MEKNEAQTAVPFLVKALKDKDRNVRINAVLALGLIGKGTANAIPTLVELLKDPNPDVREYSAYAVGRIKKGAIVAIPFLIRSLQDENTSVRISSIWALGAIGPEAKDATPAIIQSLQDDDRDVRLNAIIALGDIGTEDSIPALAKTLAQPSEDWSILDSTVESLNRIGTPKAIQEIIILNNNRPVPKLFIDWQGVEGASGYQLIYTKDDENPVVVNTQQSEFEILPSEAGTYSIEIYTINSLGEKSASPTQVSVDTLGLTAVPENPTNFQIEPINNSRQ